MMLGGGEVLGRLGLVALALTSTPGLANAAETIESIGAQRCGGKVASYEVEFLAPESAALEATAKALVKGLASPAPNAVSLSLDGKECANARCSFQARKGQTYKIAAAARLPMFDDLCVAVARP